MASPDFLEEIENFQVPDTQTCRQAVNSIGGYVYQIYQTLNAWLTLKEDEILLLEIAEDYAILTKDALNAVQVKDTEGSGSVTLKTKSVSKTVTSLWEFQQANPDKNVNVTYLTTSEIGKEKELDFPKNQSGLKYWSVAAREGTDIEPLRKALLTLDLPVQITDFIKNATTDDLREKILRRIKWICGMGDTSVIDQIVSDRLVYLGEQQNSTPSDSERAKDSLIVEVFKRATSRSNRNRVLSRADLLRTFEKAISISVSANRVRELISAIPLHQTKFSGEFTPVDTAIIRIDQIPLRPRVINRVELNTQLISKMGQSGSLWLYGSSGTGKTVLSQFIARQLKYDWLHVQLRNCLAPELEFRLCRILQALQSNKIGGVILDDFPTKYDHSIHLRLLMLTNEVHRMNGSIIVTSAKPPSPTLQSCFGENGPHIANVPYLNQDEVAELVKLAGGDSKKWASVIHSLCGVGHPQLVQARISGLQQRNWPDEELLAGIPGIGISAKEIEEECESVRGRLFDELLPNTRELLYRLTLFAGYFDRDMATAIGEIGSKIERPGEELYILLGPWVEVIANDRFRVSPLLSNAGIKTLGKPIQTEVHKQIVDQLLTRHPFPADFLGTLLSHALISRHAQGLTWLTMAIMHTHNRDRRTLSEHLFILPLLNTKQLLFKEDINISAMLRLAQFRVATWADSIDRLSEISDRLIVESRMIKKKEIADGFLYLAINSILVEQSLKISPRKWVPLIGELEQLLDNGQGEVIEHIRELDITNKKGLNDWSIPQFLFAIRASSLKSINELVELFAELDSLEENRRGLLLSSLNGIPNGKRLMIDSAWLAEMNAGNLDGIAAAEKYRQLSEIAEKWGNTDIAVECEYARAVMLDEYSNNSTGAIASLDEAAEKYPNQVRLVRQRASVYYRKKDYPAALATYTQIVDIIPKEDHISRAFAFREAAVSAVKTGYLPKADEYFTKAYIEAINASDSMKPMAIGLKADCALVKFKPEDAGDAIQLMRETIIEAEQLNPQNDIKAKYCILCLMESLRWMNAQVTKNVNISLGLAAIAGYCSNPDLPDKVTELQCPPLLVAWYYLAILSLSLKNGSNIISELRSRTKAYKILSCELMLNHCVMAKYVITADTDNFFPYLPEYVSKIAYSSENKVSDDNMYNLIDANLSVIKSADWTSELHLGIAKDAILAILVVAIYSKITDIKEKLLSHASQNQEMWVALRDFIGCFEKQKFSKGDGYDRTASYIGKLTDISISMSPDDIFIVAYRLWEWLSNSLFKDIVENIVSDYLIRHWQHIIDHQKFQLRKPSITVPALKSALGKSTSGTIKIAELLLAAETGVEHNLGVNLRTKLKEYCLNKHKREAS